MNKLKKFINFIKKHRKKKKKEFNTTGEKIREGFEVIVSAFIMALLIRAFIVSAYKIPTGSMQPTLRGQNDYGVGDHLLGDRFIFGAKVPFTDIRLPRIRSPRRLDILIFRDPRTPYPNVIRRIFDLPLWVISFGQIDLDPHKDLVKRIIGLPGETVEIKDKQVYINGELLDESSFKKPKSFYTSLIQPRGMIGEYSIYWTEKESLGTLMERTYMGNPDNFGPITVPPNAYFCMGDNRDNSNDSRFWGFVPYKYVLGRPALLYYPFNRFRIIR